MDTAIVVNGGPLPGTCEVSSAGKIAKGGADSENPRPESEAVAEENGTAHHQNGVLNEDSREDGDDSDDSLVLDAWEVLESADCSPRSEHDDSPTARNAEEPNDHEERVMACEPEVNGHVVEVDKNNPVEVVLNGKATCSGDHVDIEGNRSLNALDNDLEKETSGDDAVAVKDATDSALSDQESGVERSEDGGGYTGGVLNIADLGEKSLEGDELCQHEASKPDTEAKQKVWLNDGTDEDEQPTRNEKSPEAVVPDDVEIVEEQPLDAELLAEESTNEISGECLGSPNVVREADEEERGQRGMKRAASADDVELPSKKMKMEGSSNGGQEGKKFKKSELDKIIIETLANRLARWEVVATMRSTDQAFEEIESLKERVRKMSSELQIVKETLGKTETELRAKNAGYTPMVALTRSVSMRVTQAAITGAYQRLADAGTPGLKPMRSNDRILTPSPWKPKKDVTIQGLPENESLIDPVGSASISSSVVAQTPPGWANPDLQSPQHSSATVVPAGGGTIAMKTEVGFLPSTIGTTSATAQSDPLSGPQDPRSAVTSVNAYGGAVVPYRPVGPLVPVSWPPQTAVRSAVPTAFRSGVPTAIRSGIPTAFRSSSLPTAIRSSVPTAIRSCAPNILAHQGSSNSQPAPSAAPQAAVQSPKKNGPTQFVDLTDDDESESEPGRGPAAAVIPQPCIQIAVPLPTPAAASSNEQRKYPALPSGPSTDNSLPAPNLILGKTPTGQITLTWTMDNALAEIALSSLHFFEVYACASPDLPDSRWMKLDSVQKKPLPMVCTLSEHKRDEIFAFAVRGGRSGYASIKKRHGPFSKIVCTRDL